MRTPHGMDAPNASDPRRFRLTYLMRELIRDGVSAQDAREIALYQSVEEPVVPVRQASLYVELRKMGTWPLVRIALGEAGVDTRIRVENGAPVADVPTVEQLYTLYTQSFLPTLHETPADPLVPDLAYALHDSLENRVGAGVAPGREELLAEYLLQSMDALYGLIGFSR